MVPESPARPSRAVSWPAAIITSLVASGAVLGLMFFARSAFQIRTIPERIMEWILIFVPLNVFERLLISLGAEAKVYAIGATVAGMGLILFGLGLIALRRGWSEWLVLALGPLLWLFAMVVVMFVTGAGLFATYLREDAVLINAVYLGIGLAYASLLLLGRLLALLPATAPDTVGAQLADRRAFIVGLGSTAAAYALTAWFGRTAEAPSSTLPLVRVEPNATPSAPPVATSAVATGPVATATAATTATPELPEPPHPSKLVRDNDGALTPTGRRKGELPALITSNEEHYVVTKNAIADPVLRPDSWRLVVEGEVNRPIQIDYRALRQLPAVETYTTFECISNFTAECHLVPFGCDLISTAKWTGVRLRDLLALAGGPKPNVQDIAILAADEFSSSIPVQVALDPDTLLVYQMNDQVLPRDHGYPARLLIPGRYGMKNPKWVVAIRAVAKPFVGYYEQRGWNKEGIVKTMSRIDVPAHGATLPAGRHRIAGIAYGGKRSISKVEYSADDKATWQEARFLEPPLGQDTWVRWEGEVEVLAGGALKLWSRATDGEGNLQVEAFRLPEPDGGSGWNSIEVTSA